MRVNERGCGETLSCGTGLCATAITLRAKTGVDHWDITVRGGTVRVDVTDETVALTGSATLVADVTLIDRGSQNSKIQKGTAIFQQWRFSIFEF